MTVGEVVGPGAEIKKLADDEWRSHCNVNTDVEFSILDFEILLYAAVK